MLLSELHEEPLLYILHLLHGRDVCKLELTCTRLCSLSRLRDGVVWKRKCRLLWERKVRDMVRMSDDMELPITMADTKNRVEMDALFEKTHVPLHEKVYAFQETYNIKDSNKWKDKIKNIRKKRKLESSAGGDDVFRLDPTWKNLFSLDYLTEKFHGKYRKKKGPKLYLSPLLLYSPFTIPKGALPMPKTRGPNFQTNRFWGYGHGDEVYYVIKERLEPKNRSRKNSLSSGESAPSKGLFGRGRSNSISAPTTSNNNNTNSNEKTDEKTDENSNSSKISLSKSCNNIPQPNSTPPFSFETTALLPLGILYFEQRPTGSIDTIGGIWTVVQTRRGRLLVMWRKWQLNCFAEPLMPTKLAYEWLADPPILHPTSHLALSYDHHGPWHTGKVVAQKLWKMKPWYEQVD